jgi:aminopeptidase
MDPRVEKLADVVVNYCVAVKPGDWVVIQTSFLGEPLADACAAAILKAGGHPTLTYGGPNGRETFFHHASDEQITFIDPMTRTIVEQVDVQISIGAPFNTRSASGIDPAKMAAANKAGEPLFDRFMQRETEGSLRWTYTVFPTEAGAQDAGMSLRDYENFVYNADMLSEPDPVAAWNALGQRQQRIADWLENKSEIHITGPGTDLTVNVGGRHWVNDQGNLNFPGGEVFTGPLENATQGTIEFSFPGFYNGREVTGVRLRFEDGKVVDASATGDDAFLQEMLNMDEGARRLGEFAFGLNPGIQTFTKNTLFDEKIGGTLHMALGRSIPETKGTNISALHWDMVYELRGNGARVTVDGQTFIEDGKIAI